MKNLLILLLLTNITLASTLENPETDKMLNESLALSYHFKEFTNQQKGSTNWRSVGAGGCQYSTIQAAIDDYTQSSLGMLNIPVEFRIATNKTYFENLVIGGEYDISLKGGYSDCSNMANPPPNNQSLIDGGNNGTVLEIQGVSTRRIMTFTNLRLINGSNAAGAGGGLLSDNSNVSLLLENVDIRNNTARNGAGIALVGGDTDLLLNESLIFGNIADYGGGIYCSSSSAGADSSINVANHSGIIANLADNPLSAVPNGRGGGVYIDGCYFAIFTGSDQNGSLAGMDLNSSVNIGGAIYAENAIIRILGHQSCGSLGCLGDNTNPVSFRSNESVSRFGTALGAVLYAKNSEVKINSVWIEGNVGASLIYLEQSELVIERDPSGVCWKNSDCNLIENNIGVVFKGLSNNDIDISNVNIVGNNNTVFDISFPAASTPATLPKFRVESSMINGNGANNNYLFDFFGPIDVKFVHNTIADNQVTQSIFRTDFNPNITGPTSFEIHSSIISNPGHNVYSYDILDFSNGSGINMHVTVSASLLNETNSITAPATLTNDAVVYQGGPLLDTLAPLFIDRANGFYHLSSASPAIDYINTTFRTLVVHSDIDHQGRGYDDPNVPDLASGGNFSYYDLGADERIVVDLIFANGFE